MNKQIPEDLGNVLLNRMQQELANLSIAKVYIESKIEYLENLNNKLEDINRSLENQIDRLEKSNAVEEEILKSNNIKE